MLFLWQLYNNHGYGASLSHAFMAISLMMGIYYFPANYQVTLSRITLCNSLCYFLADLCVRPQVDKQIHHLLGLCSCIMSLFLSPEVQIFTAKVCGVLELSNPFWTYFRLRLDDSHELYLPEWYSKIVAGCVFTVVFFLSRFVIFPIFLYYELPPETPWLVFHSMNTPMWILNIYWMMLLVKGLAKELVKIH